MEFERAVRSLSERGFGTFIEVSAHPVLTLGVQQTAEDALVVGTLRRDQDGLDRVLSSLAEAHVNGVEVDWSPAFPDAHRVDLPTYPFQRQRHRLPVGERAGADVESAGLRPAGHPLLGAAVEMPGGGALLTGRISLREHPWLADHSVFGTVLLPGTAFLELAVHAADTTGCGRIEELALEAPLVLPERGAAQLQLAVDPEDESGARTFHLHSRKGDAAEWTRNATGVLAANPGAPETVADAEWPPRGADPVPVDDFYTGFTERGYGHGPAFQGLRAAWRRGDEVFAEVRLPEELTGGADRYGLHPALLDAATHAVALTGARRDDAHLPFSWQGVTLHATGATSVRVRVLATGPDTYRVALTDETGAPVATAESLTVRPVTEEQVRPAHDSLFHVRWAPVPGDNGGGAPVVAVPHDDLRLATRLTGPALPTDPAAAPPGFALATFAGGATDLASATRAVTARALELLQSWLADDRLVESTLVVCTRGAVRTGSGDPEQDLAASAVWGLVRTAQTEHPDRFVLLDLDDHPDSAAALPAALATGEPQLALRAGLPHRPRLARAAAQDASAPVDLTGTVLVTGASGTLGRLVTRHLVEAHGARDLVLLSRRGADAEGVAEWVDELDRLTASVRVLACDAGDRADLARTLAGLPTPPTAVVHVAGVLDDGVLTAQDPERLDRVFTPKVDAVVNLHELTGS
ncbi:polyketide synthase dehydratase domain-containing protein, partial [Actinosynnema sp.]|uniref:polyketide synthase dehydratase domain-containing protein n=1 Tax=Actinosynnema sp. TaxID=1872144 RepID=UPI003F85B53E